MRRRLLRAATAALLSVVVVLPAGARPAYAINWDKVVEFGVQALTTWKEVHDLKKALEQAKQEILAALNTAKADILAQMNRITVGSVKDCAVYIATASPGIDQMNPDVLQDFALSSVECITEINGMIGTITDKELNDQLGLALSTTVPLAQIALRQAGLTNINLLPVVANSYDRLMPLLDPPCDQWSPQIDPELPLPKRGEPVEWWITCTAYNGDYGYTSVTVPFPQPIPAAAFVPAKNEANRNTSHAVALAVLPLIRP